MHLKQMLNWTNTTIGDLKSFSKLHKIGESPDQILVATETKITVLYDYLSILSIFTEIIRIN